MQIQSNVISSDSQPCLWSVSVYALQAKNQGRALILRWWHYSYSPKRLIYQYVCVDFFRHRNDSSATLVFPTSTRSAAHKSLERRDKSIAKELSKHGGPRRRSCRALSQLITPPPPPTPPPTPPLSSLHAPPAGIAAPCCPLLSTVCEYSPEVVASCINCLLSHR